MEHMVLYIMGGAILIGYMFVIFNCAMIARERKRRSEDFNFIIRHMVKFTKIMDEMNDRLNQTKE